MYQVGTQVTDLVSQEEGEVTRVVEPDENGRTLWTRLEDGNQHLRHDSEVVAYQCSWFALCDRDAVKRRPHPILGRVPICERCDKKIEAMSS